MNVLTDPDSHPVIAHRGNSMHVPENTIHAFDEGVALGVDALEFDLRLTRDGVPVVIHDPTIDRTTDGRGAVSAYTVAELQQFDAGYRFTRDHGATYPWRGRGHAIPTFDEVLDRYRDLSLLIEVKEAQVAEATRDTIRRHAAGQRVVLASSDAAAVAPFRAGDEFLTGACSADTVALLKTVLLGRTVEALPYECLSIPRFHRGLPLPVVRIARAARSVGVATHVWTVDVPALARTLWARGINGIVTNDPGMMMPLRLELFGGVRDRRHAREQ